jgi:AcrR family transcriptional regulator
MNLCKVTTVSERVKSRRGYDNTKRAEQAAATRRAILDSARQLFVHYGYAKTTVEQIAVQAGVAVDTIYASIGRKPALLRELVETAISGRDHPIPARQREYVLQMKAAVDARVSIEIYAAAITEIQQRMAPVFRALRDAAVSDDSCAALWREISERRARNMRDLAAGLRSTGQLRLDLSDEQVADIIWSMNAAEYWDLLVIQRGWTPEQFRIWLTDAWTRLLLAN